MRKRLAAFFLCLTLALSCAARAEFSETLDALKTAYAAGSPVTARIAVSFDSLGGSDGTLAVVNEALSPLEATLTLSKDSEAVLLTDGGETLLSVAGEGMGDAALSPLGAAETLLALYQDVLPIFYSELAQGGKTTEAVKSLSIKNVGYAKKQTVYTYTTEEAAALLPILHELLDGRLEELLANTPFREAFITYFNGMAFADKLVVKRFMDKDGNDMGVQATAKVVNAEGGDKRSVTLFGGYSAGTGAYLSFSCPAVKGDNSLKFVLSAAVKKTSKQATLTASVDVTRRVDKERYTLATDVSLKNKLTDGETWLGTVKRSESVNGVQTAYTVTPALVLKDGALSGTVKVEKTADKASVYKLTANVSLAPGAEDAFSSARTTLKLAGLTDEEREQALAPVVKQIEGALLARLAAMPEKERMLLLTLLRTDAWMNGPSVPVPGAQETAPAPNQSQAPSESAAPATDAGDDGSTSEQDDWTVE